jgi:glycine/D-amino acid oxidase-like deaminating enzyme
MDRLRVAVIGAGAVGAGIAAALAERGSTVTLIDQNSPGAGTSAATFGWANANGKEPYSYFEINRLGLEAHHRSAARGGTWLGTPGHVEIAATAEHAARLQERVERLRSREYPAETLSIVRAQELLPGIRVPRDAELIAHFAREVADSLVFMDGGVVVEAGDPREVLSNPQHNRTKAFLSKVL